MKKSTGKGKGNAAAIAAAAAAAASAKTSPHAAAAAAMEAAERKRQQVAAGAGATAAVVVGQGAGAGTPLSALVAAGGTGPRERKGSLGSKQDEFKGSVKPNILDEALNMGKRVKKRRADTELAKTDMEAANNAKPIGEILKAILAVYTLTKTRWHDILFAAGQICEHTSGIISNMATIVCSIAPGTQYLSTKFIFSVFQSDNSFYLGVLFTLLVLNREKVMAMQISMEKGMADRIKILDELIDTLPNHLRNKRDGLFEDMVKFITQEGTINTISKRIRGYYKGNYEENVRVAMAMQQLDGTKLIKLMDTDNLRREWAKALALPEETPADAASKHESGTQSQKEPRGGGRRRTRRRRRGAKSKRKHTKKRATHRRRHSRSKKRHNRRSKMGKRRTKRGGMCCGKKKD